jgi:hypothetical protein
MGPTRSSQWVPGLISLAVKGPGSETYPLPACNVEIKNKGDVKGLFKQFP